MKVMMKVVGLVALLISGIWLQSLWQDTGVSTVVANKVALANVNGGDGEFVANQALSKVQDYISFGWYTLIAVIAFFTFKGDFKRTVSTTALLAFCMFFTSCKPYQKPVFVEIDNNETAFVIPLEGDTSSQVKFDSKESLEARKVASKRIEIPTRWIQEGRGTGNGQYIPTVKVIVVDRSPITRNWEAGSNGKGKDNAIWVESQDSVGFSMGFNCTAFIREEDTSTFLYWYSSGSLANVMDSEIRGRIQQVAAEESAMYPLDELRSKKNEISVSVKTDVIKFFEGRGITITTIGMFGGMTYENPKIQDSIDNVFVAQQEKNVALAKFDAQKKENERVILAAEGNAKQRQIDSEAEAKAITALTQAVATGGPNYLQLKSLEVQLKQTEKWDGKLPQITSGAAPLIDAGRFMNK